VLSVFFDTTQQVSATQKYNWYKWFTHL